MIIEYKQVGQEPCAPDRGYREGKCQERSAPGLRFFKSKGTARRAPTDSTGTLLATLAALVVLLSVPTPALSQNVGEAGFIGSWKDLPLAARGAAMGNAYVSIAEGGYGYLSNPGGLSHLRERSFTTSYRFMNFDRKLSLVSLVFPLREEATIGFTWVYADYGNVETRSASGRPLGGEIGQDEHQIGIVFSKRFSRRVSIGFAGGFYQWKLDVVKANSVLFDAGVVLYIDNFLYDRESIGRLFVTDIQVGFAIRSVGSSFIINTSNYWEANGSSNLGQTISAQFPRVGALGVSGRVLDGTLLLSTELEYHENLGPRGKFGGEYELAEQLKLRAGLDRGALTAGAGFYFNLGKSELSIDYAFQAQRVDERADHLFTIDLGF